MKKYRWNLLKSLEYLNSRRPNLEIRAFFIQQLSQYESHLATQGEGCKTANWTQLFDTRMDPVNEELLLRNTFINSQMGPLVELEDNPRPAKRKIVFSDGPSLATEIKADMSKTASVSNSHARKKPIIKKISTTSRNPQVQTERSYGRKGKPTKFNLPKEAIQKIKLVQSEQKNNLQKKHCQLEYEKNSSPTYILTEENDPDSMSSSYQLSNSLQKIGHHRNGMNKQLPPKVNNFTEENPTHSLQRGSQFMNMLKKGLKPKNETNIIQNPSIHNYIIFNQPNIQVINNSIITPNKKAQGAQTERSSIRPNSCKSKENQKETVPFPKNFLNGLIKNITPMKEIKMPNYNTNKIITSSDKVIPAAHILRVLKNEQPK